MTDPLTLADAALRGAVLALLALLALRLDADLPQAVAARLGRLLAAGLAVQAVVSAPAFGQQVPRGAQWPGLAVSLGNGALFWLFALALFRDGWRPRPRHALAWLAAAVVGALQCLTPAPAVHAMAQATPLLFAALAIAAALAHWRDDLVERRRRLRAVVVFGGSAYTLLTTVARLATPGGPRTAAAATLDMALLLAVVGPVAALLLRASAADLFPAAPLALPSAIPSRPPDIMPNAVRSAPPSATPPRLPEPQAQQLAATLQRLMGEERAYRDDRLDLATLAERAGVPEYRLRRHIHQTLGCRNFSAYVNGLRVDEAQRRLADPAERSRPVLEIAMDAGFGSVGPFNRAFKAVTGLTPTEFRRARLADS